MMYLASKSYLFAMRLIVPVTGYGKTGAFADDFDTQKGNGSIELS